MKTLLLALALALALTPVGQAHADATSDASAKALFLRASAAFEQQHYEEAHALFKQAYLLSPRPELLFNMASSLQRLNRPHEAAEQLRAFLRVRPSSTERPELEERIRALEEAQRLRDAEVAAAPTPVIVAATVATPATVAITAAAAPRARTPVYKKWWLWTVVGVVVAGAATGVALGITQTRATEPLLEPVRF